VTIGGTVAASKDMTLAPQATNGFSRDGASDDALRCRVSGSFSTKKVSVTFILQATATLHSLVAITAP
jgi:hypothetical protein